MIEKSGSAKWSGGLQDGQGSVSAESGALADVPYSFAKRFEDAKGTNPEELIGAAHAACFSMALSMVLAEHDLTADSIETKADGVHFKMAGGAGGAFLMKENKLPVGQWLF